MLDVLVVGGVGIFVSYQVTGWWTLSDVLSAQLFFHVLVVVWELPSTIEAGTPIQRLWRSCFRCRSCYEAFEDSFSYSNQLGQRQGAGVHTSTSHPDIIFPFNAKKENADERVRCQDSYHLVLCLMILRNRKMKKCASSALLCRKKEYGVPFNYRHYWKIRWCS